MKSAESAVPKTAAVFVAVEALTPWAKNPRKNDPAVKAVADSIKRFGFGAPLLARQANGEIIAGHTRLKAAIKLGLTEVPVRYLDLNESEAHALALADNKVGELAEWDDAVLAEVLKGMADAGENIEKLGWSSNEIEKMIRAGDAGEDGEVIEPPAEPITKPGDLWLLGDHRLLCGDSTKSEDVDRLINGEKADLLLSDPPYGVDYEGITNDDAAGLPNLLESAMSQADRSMRPGACYYICHPDVHAYEFIRVVRERGWKQARPSVIVWVKDRFVLGRGDYHSQSEPILYGWKEGASHHAVQDRTQSNVWQFDRPSAAEGHPTMKPVGLFAKAAQNSTNSGELIYDPFLGSGTTLIVAEQLGRKCYGMEISPAYCDVIVKRWETMTGKKATLDV